MDKLEKLLKQLRGNDKKIAQLLNITNEKAYRLFALGAAVFLSSVFSIAALGVFGSVVLASYVATGSLAMLGPLGIILCNRYQRRQVVSVTTPQIFTQKEGLKLDLHEEWRMIDEMKITKKDMDALKIQAYNEYKQRAREIEQPRLIK